MEAIAVLIKSMFGDFFSDYIKDFLKITIGWIADRGYLLFISAHKPQLKLLGVKPNDKWTLYFGNIVDGDPRSKAFEQSSQQYIYGDIESTLIAGEVFSSLFDQSPEYSRHFISDDKLSGVLLSVGGPKWNAVTARLIGVFGCPIKYEDGYKGLVVLKPNGEERHEYKETLERTTRYINDIGVILLGRQTYFSKNQLGNVKAACVIMGYSTYGVRLAAEFLKSIKNDEKKFKELLRNDIPSGSSRVCLLIHGKVQIGLGGEVIAHHIDRHEVLTDSSFVDAYLYSY